MVAPGFLDNPEVRRWLYGVEPAWTMLKFNNLSALRHEPSCTNHAIRLEPDLASATACSLASLRRSVRHADFAGAKRASNFLEEVSAPGRRSRSLAVLCIHLEPRACLLLEGDQGFEFPPSESKSCRRWAI